MNKQIKQAARFAPHAGSALRQGITALVAIAGTMDLIPESKVDSTTAAVIVLANIAWSIYAKHQALKAKPPEAKQ